MLPSGPLNLFSCSPARVLAWLPLCGCVEPPACPACGRSQPCRGCVSQWAGLAAPRSTALRDMLGLSLFSGRFIFLLDWLYLILKFGEFLCILDRSPLSDSVFCYSQFSLSIILSMCVLSCFSCVDSATLWTIAHQAPLSMAFPRQRYWSGLPFPSLGDLPCQG